MKHGIMIVKKLFFIIFFALIVVYLAYCNTPYYIKKYWWKNNCEVRSIGDYLDFREEKNTSIKWPYIYYGNKRVARILFCCNRRLWVYSDNTPYKDNEYGEYYGHEINTK